MKTPRTLALIAIAAALASVASLAQDHEKKIARAQLPAAVEKTVSSQAAGATINGFTQEQEKGETFYEAELLVRGHSKDILIDKAGNIVEIEEQVEFATLPAAVQSALQAKAGKGKLSKVESLTKHDKLVAYESTVTSGGKRTEIQVGPDGNTLDHEE